VVIFARPEELITNPPTAGWLRLQKRADARRVEILRAAARVFRERGFAAAGMREIALAADLSPGNLYHYFRGKDEILFFCQDQALDRLIKALARARTARGPIAARLRDLAHTHVLCLVDEVQGSAAHLEIDALPPPLREVIVRKRDLYERGVRSLVAAGIRRGELRSTDPTVATRAFLGALNWTAQWFRPEGTQSPEGVATLVAEYAVAGLGGEVEVDGTSGSRAAKRRNRTDRQRRADTGRVRAV
jgi:AcrR family transcriptional regulator